MNKSESIAALAAALAKAQGSIRGALKDSDNPFFKSKYADLASVVEAIREAFASNGIAYVQTIEPSEKNEVRVETILMHASGEWIACGILALPVAKADAQGVGSAITYARRYSLSAAAGVAPEDDDGNAATKAAPKAIAWTEEESQTARTKVEDLKKELKESGMDESELRNQISKPEATIGDPMITLETWAKRFQEFRSKQIAKLKS
jgi:hypothetical protein